MQTNEVVVKNTPNRVIMGNTGNANKIAEAEQELAELLAQERPEVSQAQETVETPAEVKPLTTAVEPPSVWEKRYRDLQAYLTKTKEELKAVKAETKMSYPKTEEEVKTWMSKYPDVAAIVETIAMKKAESRYGDLETRMKEYEQMRIDAIIQKTEAAIIKVHPDYEDIKHDNDFHNWVETLPKATQDIVYDTIDRPNDIIRLITLYKKETDKDTTNLREAATTPRAVARSEAKAVAPNKYAFRESDIAKMSPREFDARLDEIEKARIEGKILYDISGKK